ncbi:hypothetical protein AVEN_56778-1 [Araneus ventricosus]|uniref:Uncharacterized protein n=1 Tax=Araneus ventricosus TaxID=182803 RepID=A0A4Y2HAA0_ARAVE|nr:hypothetical protein AVEN_56778-1 [Araneus ventricosus]
MRKKHNKISALKGPTSIAFSNTDKAEIIADSLQNQFTLNSLTDTATENLRVAIVVPILKPGKVPTDPTNYRPISLLPTLSKVTEHFILLQLNDFLNKNNILIPYQFGFKPKLYTTYKLLGAVEFIASGFENRFGTGAVFLDIQTYKLISHKIPNSLIKLITTTTTGRRNTGG